MNGRIVRVESESNDRFRQLELLNASSRERRKQQRSVIEGVKAISAFVELTAALAQEKPADVHDVFIAPDSLNDVRIKALLQSLDRPVVLLSAALFRRASQVATSAGPIAIIDTPRPALPEVFCDELVYLDRIQDPGNIGTILRTCAAAGVKRVLTSRGTAFCWAPKVLRAAMGAHFALQIFEGVEPAVLLERIAPSLAIRAMVAPAASPAGSDLHRSQLTHTGVWLFGNEGQGLRSELLAVAHERLTINQEAQAESLNVAAAVAVCLFEARRQRAFAMTDLPNQGDS